MNFSYICSVEWKSVRSTQTVKYYLPMLISWSLLILAFSSMLKHLALECEVYLSRPPISRNLSSGTYTVNGLIINVIFYLIQIYEKYAISLRMCGDNDISARIST